MVQNFFKKKLSNGLMILFEKRELPIVSVALATKFGSGDESEKEKGISHFIEHMLFKGTKKRTSLQIASEIEEKGGEHNAFTAKTLTAAWIRIPSKHLVFSVEILSDMFYNSKFEGAEMEKERGAILEEINMYHDNPMRHIFEKLNELMFSRPFGSPALGSKESVSGFTRDDLIRKHEEYYSTDNLILAVVGNADFEKIIELGEKYFSKMSKTGKKQKIAIGLRSGVLSEKRKELDQAHLAFGIHFPSLNNKKRYSAEIFNSIFADGSASRIFQEIREKRGLAYAVIGSLDQEASYGQQLIYIGTVKDKIELAKKIILEEFRKMQNIKQEELDKTKEKLISARELEREDSRNVLTELVLEEVAGKAEEYYAYEKEIRKASLTDVRDFSKIKEFSFISLTSD